jgi:N-acetylglucosaminyl-diphospho-decaprenol L-rhamnosyltransferase
VAAEPSAARASVGGAGAPSSAAAPALLVVVVNYRTADVTIACLRSLAAEIPAIPGARVVVVDNGSGDGSASRIEAAIGAEGFRGWASVLPLAENGGFAHGNNRGIAVAPDARHFLLLNSDTVVSPGSLRHCLAALEADPGVGALSCMLLNADGSMQNVARRFPSPLRRAAGALGLPWRLPRAFRWADLDDPSWDRWTEARDVDWLGGAFLLVRGDVVRRIGGLDEDFFFYGEDVEFCHRVRRAGFRCRYDPAVSIVHLGGTSSDPSRLATGAKLAHAWRARHLVHGKLYGRRSAAAFLALDRAIFTARLAYLAWTTTPDDARYAQAVAVLALLRRSQELQRPRTAAGVETPACRAR